jgi:hypothetical protein
MKKQVKGFGQYINESKRVNENEFYGDSIDILTLFDCYAEKHFSDKFVMISVDPGDDVMSLTHGGIEITANPEEDEIREARDRGLILGLYEMGKQVDYSDGSEY